ncbi:hypothetical protein WJX84_003553 [Apatococcus fuscideae]|uniref:GCK domain-containing protein n=1 Tax=Apatococcus fuscideae TaxID=2026836 RepID=A0AAW1SUL3_9CHLO
MSEKTDRDPEDAGQEEEEEEETCGFCIFMKGGGCKNEFTGWEKCVDQARETEQDFTEGCREQTQALQQCMLDNKDYYAPLLEGQASPLDAAEDSSEEHIEATALADSMAPSESQQEGSPAINPPASESSSQQDSKPAEDSPTDTESPEAKDSGSESKEDQAEDTKGSAEEKADDGSNAQQQEHSKDKDSDSGGAEEDAAGGGEPFDLPAPGTEDKTGMPGEPEPEPEEEEGGEGEGDEEEEDKPPEVKVESTPFDVRFPGTNQARHCYTRYNEFHKCQKTVGEEDERCNVFQKAYRSICPGEWVERWNEQRENGTWPGRW